MTKIETLKNISIMYTNTSKQTKEIYNMLGIIYNIQTTNQSQTLKTDVKGFYPFPLVYS